MPQKIKHGYRALIDDAEREIETLSIEDALALHGRDDVAFIDVRDIRELDHEGRMPGAFHCPRGMLEFWIDPASPYHKPEFAQDKRFVFFCGRRLAFGARRANRPSHGPWSRSAYRGRLRRVAQGERSARSADSQAEIRVGALFRHLRCA